MLMLQSKAPVGTPAYHIANVSPQGLLLANFITKKLSIVAAPGSTKYAPNLTQKQVLRAYSKLYIQDDCYSL